MQGFRSATSVLVLSTALLIGSAGGATAVADTDSSDSASHSSNSDAAGAENSASTASSVSVESLRDSVTASLDDLGSLLSREDDSTQLSANGIDTEDARDSVVAGAEADVAIDALVESELTGDQSIPDSLSTTVSEATAMEPEVAPEPVVSAPVVSAPVSRSGESGAADPVAAVPTKLTPKGGSSPTLTVVATAPKTASTGQGNPSGTLDPATATPPPTLAEALAELTVGMVGTSKTIVVTLGDTIATVVISMGDAAAAIPPTIKALPTSPTPISDVIALAEIIMDSVAESANAVIRFPSDLAANLGYGTIRPGTPPVLIGAISPRRQHMVLAEDGPVMPIPAVGAPLPAIAPQQLVDDVVARSAFAAQSPIAFAALAEPSQMVPASIPGMAGEWESLFDRAFGAMLVPLSLWALATGALPGLVGLLVVFGAGARVGYRQAKAGFALKVAGIARYAGPGPLGVVRSGSLVALHQRGVRAGGQRIARWSHLADQAA